MKLVQYFEAEDGKHFDNETECLDHERRLEIVALWENMNASDIVHLSRINDLYADDVLRMLINMGELADEILNGAK